MPHLTLLQPFKVIKQLVITYVYQIILHLVNY